MKKKEGGGGGESPRHTPHDIPFRRISESQYWINAN